MGFFLELRPTFRTGAVRNECGALTLVHGYDQYLFIHRYNRNNMTLAFSQKFPNGQPTDFVQKIWSGMTGEYLTDKPGSFFNSVIDYFPKYEKYKISSSCNFTGSPKIHTIRRDSKDRWREGMDIHFVINNRTKDRFQFAPIVKVKKIQKVEIQYLKPKDPPLILIDGKTIDPITKRGLEVAEQLAINDGFDSFKSFCVWFSEDFTGKIIHWTAFYY